MLRLLVAAAGAFVELAEVQAGEGGGYGAGYEQVETGGRVGIDAETQRRRGNAGLNRRDAEAPSK